MIVTTAFSKFTEKELRCKGTGVILIDKRFADAITDFRENIYGKPMTPTSVCRTPEHNKAVNGHPSSLHLTDNPVHKTNGTAAMDVHWHAMSTEEKLNFAALAYKSGFSVGLHNIFCHLDLRTIAGLPQHCFLYGEWDKKTFQPKDVVTRSMNL